MATRSRAPALLCLLGLGTCTAWRPVAISRRDWVVTGALGLVTAPAVAGAASLPAQKAVGNAREGLDLDAALGITWGGRKRCDAQDLSCGADGSDVSLQAAAVPTLGTPTADTFTLQVKAAGASYDLRLVALEEADAELRQALREVMRAIQRNGGTILRVDRGSGIVLGQRNQAQAYARKRGMMKPPAEFQGVILGKGRESGKGVGVDMKAAPAAPVPGLVALRRRGGDADALEVRLSSGPGDKGGIWGSDWTSDWAVVARLDSEESMRTLARLDVLPVQRSLHDGEPLVKTQIDVLE